MLCKENNEEKIHSSTKGFQIHRYVEFAETQSASLHTGIQQSNHFF